MTNALLSHSSSMLGNFLSGIAFAHNLFSRNQPQTKEKNTDEHSLRRVEALRSPGRKARWLIGFVLFLLLTASLTEFFYQHFQYASLGGNHFRLMVFGPSVLHVGAPAYFDINTRTVVGKPASAAVELGLYSSDGKCLFALKERTDEQGHWQAVFQPDKAFHGIITLKVAAMQGGIREEASIPLAVEAVRESPDRALFQSEMAKFFHRQSLPLSNKNSTKDIIESKGKINVRFFPDGGNFAAGLENRVYFLCRDTSGKPLHVLGTVVNQDQQIVAQAETIYHGAGQFSFTPQRGESYRLRILSPQGIKDEPQLPQASDDCPVVLSTGTQGFASSGPLEFNIHSAKSDLPLVVGAWLRGVLVAQAALVTKNNENGMNPVVMQLPEGVSGVILLAVFDYSVHPEIQAQTPKLLAQRLVCQRCDPQSFFLGSYGQTKPEKGKKETEKFAVGLGNKDAEHVSPAVALDLFLGTYGWGEFAKTHSSQLKQSRTSNHSGTQFASFGNFLYAPAMYDNLEKIRSDYQKGLSDSPYNEMKPLYTSITISFLAAFGLLVLVMMLALFRILRGAFVWLSLLCVLGCGVLLGDLLHNPDVSFLADHRPKPAFLNYPAPLQNNALKDKQ
ncbi:MAG: hypothetical protein ACWGMZ_02060 [Thermoguttaceae bacterium]